MYVNTYAYKYICIYTYLQLNICKYAYMNIHTYIHTYTHTFMHTYIQCIYTDYLLTQYQVFTGKYLRQVFVQASDEGVRSLQKTRGRILSRTAQTNEANKEFLLLLVSSVIAFNEFFSLEVSGLGLFPCFYLLLRVFSFI